MAYDITKSWLNSDNIFKRALAVWCYAMLGYLTVILSIVVIMIGLGLIASVFSILFAPF